MTVVRLLAGGALVVALAGPRSLGGQVRQEVGVQGVWTTERGGAVTLGPAWGFRPGRRDRIQVSGMAGWREGGMAGRVEAAWHFLLQPEARGPGFYLGAGVGVLLTEATVGRLLLLVGLESNPRGRGGWFAEAGAGGGLRIAAGFRWRR